MNKETEEMYAGRTSSSIGHSPMEQFFCYVLRMNAVNKIYGNGKFIESLENSLKNDLETRNFIEAYETMGIDKAKAEDLAIRSAFPRILKRKMFYLFEVDGLNDLPFLRDIEAAVLMTSISLAPGKNSKILVDTPEEIGQKEKYFTRLFMGRGRIGRRQRLEEGFEDDGFEDDERDTVRDAKEFYKRK